MKVVLQNSTKTIISAIFICLVLNLFFFSSAFAALSGNYTINPSNSASATNYKSWASAISDLKLGTRTDGGPVQGPAVSGPVNFTVAAGTYSTQIDIPLIQGVSSTNTITFDGGNAALCIILANSTSYPNYAVVRFDTCRFITIKNFTITSTVTADVNNSYAVHFLGTASASCDNNSVVNCVINVAYQAYISTALTGEMIYGVLFNGSGLTNTKHGYFQNNVVSGCTINNGYYGIYGVGTNDSATGNQIKNCTLSNYFSAGIDVNSMNGVKITGNTLSSNHTTYKYLYGFINTGMMITNCGASATDFTDISQNKINTFYQFGISMSGCPGRSGLRTRVSNNFILKGFLPEVNLRRVFCLLLSGCDTTDILNNSFSMNYPVTSFVLGNAAAFYEDGQSKNINVINNIFNYSATSGNAIPFYSAGTITRYLSFDYNIFYNADSAKSGFINSINYSTANVGGLNANSFITNPNFKSLTDLHIQNYSLGKQGTSDGIITDIDGETRGTPPIIGADDFPALANNDLSISTITAPVSPVNTGTQTISVQITNVGTNTVSSATVYYALNGAAPVSQAWSGSLAQNASAAFTFTTKGNFVAGLNTLKVFVSQPNGSADSYHGNDTLTIPIYSTLSGVYTINPSSAASTTNFISFTSAANGLNGGLVTGAVTINIAAGTYNEQIELDPIKGSSATNTVKFDGKDTGKVTLTWNGVLGNQTTINLKGCRYVTFTHIKIEGQNPDYAWPVHFYSDSTNYNRISNCVITVPSIIVDNLNEVPVSFGETNSFVIPYLMPPIVVKYNEIDSCLISGGTAGIYFSGGLVTGIDTVNVTNNNFIGNTIVNCYSWGIYLLTANGSKVLNNFISPSQSTAGGIFIYASRDSHNTFIDVSGNLITNFGANLFSRSGVVSGGVELSGCSGGAAGDMRVSNNMVGGLIKNSTCLYMSGCTNVDIVFNSFNYSIDGAQTFNNAAVFDNSVGPNTFMNNIFGVTAEVGLATCFFEENDTSKFLPSNFDYNIFYNNANSNSAYIGGVMHTQTNVVGAGGFNTHSYTMNPSFISASNLHITSQSNLGISFAGITTDIDNQTRASKPCIGADEINIGCSVPVIAAQISGDTIICQGQTGVIFTVPAISGASGYDWTFPAGATIVSGGNTNSVNVNFSSNAYEGPVTVKGINTCGSGSISLPLFLNINTSPILTFASTNANCHGDCNGTALVNVQGSGSYKYNWNTTDTTATISGLCPGNYGVTVTDDFGCSAAVNGSINNPSLLTVVTNQSNDTCIDCHNGTAGALGIGGTAPYSYNWSNGETTQTISGLEQGIYTVCVVDAHGCITCDSVVIGAVTTGILKVSGERGIMVFPNPNNGYFTIKLDGVEGKQQAQLFTITGQKLMEETISASGNYSFNISEYGKGVYLLQITSEKGVERQKIVVQ